MLRRSFIMLTLGFLCLSRGYAAEVQEVSFHNPQTQFILGNLQYKDGHYKEASQAYEEVLKNNMESEALYYNLANSYFKLGQLGKAILNYERARRLMPRDSDLQSNYQFALSQVKGERGEVRLSWGRKIFRRYAGHWTQDELAMILFCIYLFMGCVYLFYLFFHLSKGKTIFLISVLAVFFVFHVAVLIDKINNQKDLAVVIHDTEAKFEPVENSTTHFRLWEGHEITILKQEGDWLKIKRPDGKMGWISLTTAQRI